MSPFLRNLAIIAGVALVVVLLNLEVAVVTVGLILRIAFVLAIALVAYLYWRDIGRREIETWPSRVATVFYCAVGLFVADAGWWMITSPQGLDALAAILVAAACVFVGVRLWRGQKSYA